MTKSPLLDMTFHIPVVSTAVPYKTFAFVQSRHFCCREFQNSSAAQPLGPVVPLLHSLLPIISQSFSFSLPAIWFKGICMAFSQFKDFGSVLMICSSATSLLLNMNELAIPRPPIRPVPPCGRNLPVKGHRNT